MKDQNVWCVICLEQSYLGGQCINGFGMEGSRLLGGLHGIFSLLLYTSEFKNGWKKMLNYTKRKQNNLAIQCWFWSKTSEIILVWIEVLNSQPKLLFSWLRFLCSVWWRHGDSVKSLSLLKPSFVQQLEIAEEVRRDQSAQGWQFGFKIKVILFWI